MMSYNHLPPGASAEIKPFTINIPDDRLSNLQQLLDISPIPEETYENSCAHGAFGINRKWLVDAVKNWKNTFDWRAYEKRLNDFPHFLASIIDDDKRVYQMHFMALFSIRANAPTIICLHGWPGSFAEFSSVLSLLRGKYDTNQLPYNVIVPSLPGFTFSSPPPSDVEFRSEDIARLVHKLALAIHPRGTYVVQGGDLGSRVAQIMAATYEECKALHLNLCFMAEPENPVGEITDVEYAALERAGSWKRTGMAYAMEHATRPSTIGLALGSSPVALLAWVGEKWIEWTDETPSIEQILEMLSLYWFTRCFPTSIYTYRHAFNPVSAANPQSERYYIRKPFGFSWFPREVSPVPRAWIATVGDLSFFRRHEKGGHFAAFEEPEALLGDLEDFLKQVGMDK